MSSLAEKAAQAFKILAAAIAAIFRFIFGGVSEAATSLAGDARRITRAARRAAEATGRAAGRVLDGPARALDLTTGAIGQTLGALLPQRPVGPRDVADAAVARDDRAIIDPVSVASPAARAQLTAVAMEGNTIQFAAAARARGDAIMARSYDEDLAPHVRVWLDGLSPRQVAYLASLDCYAISAHVDGRSLTSGLPAVPAQPAPATAREDMQRMLAEIRRNARTDRAGVAEMMTRGPRPPSLPDDDEGYVPPRRSPPGPRPSFH